MKNLNGLRETKDGDLVTPEAINFRIEKIKRENATLTPALAKRIAALRLRLPKDPNVTVLEKAINPALLVSKSDVDEFGKSPLAYA